MKNVELNLQKPNEKLPSYAPSPFTTNYRPEVDVSAELETHEASYYQSLTGMLRWIVELGRVDIELSMMASMMASPMSGYLKQLYHIFAYLKKHHNAEMLFDPSYPNINENLFPKYDWGHTVYSHAKELIPNNAPKAKGFGFTIIAFVDSDHAGDIITRKSRTGFIVK